MEVKHLKRKFIYKPDGEKQVDLEEVSPNMTPEQHLKHYTGFYPKLAVGSVKFVEIVPETENEEAYALYEMTEHPGDRG